MFICIVAWTLTWLLLENIWPCFLPFPFPDQVLGWQSQVPAPVVWVLAFRNTNFFFFFGLSCSSCSVSLLHDCAFQHRATCSLPTALCSKPGSLLLWPLLKHKGEIKACVSKSKSNRMADAHKWLSSYHVSGWNFLSEVKFSCYILNSHKHLLNRRQSTIKQCLTSGWHWLGFIVSLGKQHWVCPTVPLAQ